MEKVKERLFSKEQVRGCILGGAVGDALGYPVEFMSYDQIRQKYGNRGITNLELDKNGVAQISDDTQMTLFTATGLLFASTRGHTHGVCGDPDNYVRMHYVDWYATQTGGCQGGYGGSWLGWEKRMYERRAPGNTCMDALEIIRRGETVENNSKGCGGVMRVAPVAICNDYSGLNEDLIATMAAKIAGITHKHPLGILPAAALAMIIRRIVVEQCPPNFNCLAGLVQRVATDVLNTRIEYRENSETYYQRWPRECEKLTALLRRTVDCAFCPDTDEECIRQIGQGWTADEALAIAVFCVLRHPDSFEDAVTAAVNHDGDSDSTGAICGNIMGVLLGEKGIPERFLEKLEVKDLIDEVADDFYIGCRISEWGPLEEISQKDAMDWELKYVFSSSLRRKPSWDAAEFKKEFDYALERFRKTHDEKYYQKIRALRVQVFENTMSIVKERRYWVHGMSPMDLYYSGSKQPEFYKDRIVLPKAGNGVTKKTKFFVVNEDCLDLSLKLHDKKPAVLNMASRRQPGGGALTGAGAQEESIFRRTDLFKYLYQFSEIGVQFGIKQREEQYPLDRNYGGIYTPNVHVFRKGEKDGYALMHSTYVDIISVAGMNRPELKDNEHIADYLVEPIKNKMRTILRIALLHEHTCLVLGALGCGAFRNPPRHVARMFHEVFEEPEFKGRFSEVYFAILEDHNSHKSHNPQGNLKPFMDEFGVI